MPELELCVYCKKPIKPDDLYVKTEPAARDSKDIFKPFYTQHAHVKCYEQMEALELDSPR
jgi:hypothetical protein